MRLPTLEQYNEAAQNPAVSFYDVELKAGKIKKNMLGLPFAVCGGFALTYNLTCAGRKYAVRCFHKEVRDLADRYAAISRKLSSLNSPYFVDFRYQDRGIMVRGQPYPIVKMSWAKGKTLGEFMIDNIGNSGKIAVLRESLTQLSFWLRANRMAHGDIQPGNVMVDDAGHVQLIDYDGMYIPEIGNMGARETGHRNFQHPLRASENPWNENLDNFSFILVWLALSVFELEPDLWNKTGSDGDKFVFSANDLANPGTSQIFTQLLRFPSIKDRVSKFASICLSGISSVPPLEQFLDRQAQFKGQSRKVSSHTGYISTYPVLDASDYDACLTHVGEIVELVGKVHSARIGKTKFGGLYCFINFSDWRGKSVKLAIWPKILKKLCPDDLSKFKILEGQWLSAKGLLQPPYEKTTATYSYSHIYIDVNMSTPFNIISKEEAEYRFEGETGDTSYKEPEPQTNAGSKRIIPCPECGQRLRVGNGETLIVTCPKCGKKFVDDISGKYHSQRDYSASQQPSANKDILDKIKNNSGQQYKKEASAPCPSCHRMLQFSGQGKALLRCCVCNAEFTYDFDAGKIVDEITKPAGSNTNNPPTQNPPRNESILNSIKNSYNSGINKNSEIKPNSGTSYNQGNNYQQPANYDNQNKADNGSWFGWIVAIVSFLILLIAMNK